MARKSSSKLKKVIYIILSFILSCLMLVTSVSLLLNFTLFNKDFIINCMNDVSYFEIQKSEISRNLMDLGYASGLDENFFDNLIDESLLREDVSEYLTNFYSGDKTVIKTDNFKTVFNNAIDEYIVKKGINPESVSESSRNYLVDNATKIYRESLQIPFLSNVAGYFLAIKNVIPMVVGVCIILMLFIGIILVFSTKWKHRSIRYICYATTTTFLCMIVPFAVSISTRKIRQLNITSKAIYDFFVKLSDSVTMYMLYFSIFFAVVSVVLFLLFKYLYPRKSHSETGKGSLKISED